MKPKFSITAFILFITIQSASFAHGQENSVGMPGAAMPAYQQQLDEHGDRNCFVYAKFVIKTAPADDNGSIIFVYERDGNKTFKEICENGEAEAVMTLDDSFQFFVGLSGDKIFIDSGTSAGERGLTIVDLPSRTTVYSTSYYNDPKIVGKTLLYDLPTKRKGAWNTCQDWREWHKSGGGIGWVQPVRLNLTTLTETPVGKLKCVFLE